MDIYIVSKIKKVRVKDVNVPHYLVSWDKSSNDTWEPINNFPDDINTYPGYNQSLYNLLKNKPKRVKDAIYTLLEFNKFEKVYYYT